MSVPSANKLGKSYQFRRAVDDVSLTVHSGQVVGTAGSQRGRQNNLLLHDRRPGTLR